MTLPFDFEVPVSFFEKADAGKGKTRRIGGIISTASRDRQKEKVIQDGLDLSDFLASGWFNDNHSKATDGILGYPEKVQQFKEGDTMPNGMPAPVNGTWAEGYLLDTEKADKIWELGNALQKTEGRRLGFSIEGQVLKREGKGGKTIAKAKVRNVAITNCPVNPDTRLDVLAKSLEMLEQTEIDDTKARLTVLEKALAMGPATPGVAPVGPQTGEGAGQVLATESLESDEEDSKNKRSKLKLAVSKSLSEDEAIAWVQSRVPTMSKSQAKKFVSITKKLKESEQI